MPVNPPKAGLEDVVAATSEICFIDGHEGHLVYHGYDMHDLVAHSTFEETIFLLFHLRLPSRQELERFDAALGNERALPPPALELLARLPRSSQPMALVRTMVSALGLFDPDGEDSSIDAARRKALRLTAQMATLVAAIGRHRAGQAPVAPDPKLSHSADFLYMLSGQVPDAADAKVFDAAMVMHADHELNASTFAARVTAGTLSDIYSAVTSAVGALKGPLHGGANEAVMRMLKEIDDPDRAEAYIQKALADRRKIMGFGHRVYRTEDPRATHLRRYSLEVGERHGDARWYRMSRRIEAVVLGEKGLFPNVDFFSASTYYMLGIPIDLFTPVFAVSRISGWCAHILEQYANNRLIRPRAEYVGPTREAYIPIDER